MCNRFTGGDVETYDLGPKVHVLADAEFMGMKECIRDQGNRIEELERDAEAWRSAYIDSENERSVGEREAAARLAEEEADLFHAAYVGMCAMHPNRALSIGHSQQEH